MSSQPDTEKADHARATRELAADVESDKEELARIYVSGGVEADLARQVAQQLMVRDALAAHAPDISEDSIGRPLQAALASAATFSVGAAAPLAIMMVSSASRLLPAHFRGLARVPGPARLAWRTDRRCRYP